MIRIRYFVEVKTIVITQTACLYQLVVEREIKNWSEKRMDEIKKDKRKGGKQKE